MAECISWKPAEFCIIKQEAMLSSQTVLVRGKTMIFQKSNQRTLPNILVWSDIKVTFLVVLKVLKHCETNAH